MRDYKKIKAYELADKLVMGVYGVTSCFPKEENYGLTSQIRRAVVSVATNIVEGASRQHKKDYLNFLFISRSSLAEVEYLIDLSEKLKYLDHEEYVHLKKLKEETVKTLFGLIKAVKNETEI